MRDGKARKVSYSVRNKMVKQSWFYVYLSSSVSSSSRGAGDLAKWLRCKGQRPLVFHKAILFHYCSLCCWARFLQYGYLVKYFPSKEVDLIEAAKEASVVIDIVKTKRTDPLVWTMMYECGRQPPEFDIEPRMMIIIIIIWIIIIIIIVISK